MQKQIITKSPSNNADAITVQDAPGENSAGQEQFCDDVDDLEAASWINEGVGLLYNKKL